LTGVVSKFPYDVSWYHNGINVLHKFTSILVKPKHDPNHVISTLHILDSQPSKDEGTFQIQVQIFCESKLFKFNLIVIISCFYLD